MGIKSRDTKWRKYHKNMKLLMADFEFMASLDLPVYRLDCLQPRSQYTRLDRYYIDWRLADIMTIITFFTTPLRFHLFRCCRDKAIKVI